jgi:MATE family multidrug resistance protein
MGVKGSASGDSDLQNFHGCFPLFCIVERKRTRRYIKDFSLKIQDFSKKMFDKMVKTGIAYCFTDVL